MTPKRIRAAAAIPLVGVLVLFLWSRHDSGRSDSRLTIPQPGESQVPVLSNSVSPATSEAGISESAPGNPERRSATTPPPDYESTDFVHVPDWMPRPADAASASAEDASLRSDGVVEGTLRFIFHEDQTSALQDIATHLEAVGMSADGTGLAYASEDPPRRCELRVETQDDGAMLVSLSYQGIDHEKGCLCPTCGNPTENPNP